MKGRVVVSSFHSSSVAYIEDYCPDAVASLDSHADTYVFGRTEKLMEVANSMPQKLRDAVLRPSTHSLIRRRMPDIEIFIVVPLTCLYSATVGELENVKKLLGSHETSSESTEMPLERVIEFQNLFIEKILRMKLYPSPPNSLKELARKMKGQCIAIDIDMDYLSDAQGECYTMAPGLEIRDGVIVKPRKSEMGSVDKVFKFIKLIKPKLITVSEARLEALQTTNSFTNRFLKLLRALRYEVEYGFLMSSDVEAHDLIDRHKRFVDGTLRDIQRRYIDQRSSESEIREEEEIAIAMRDHFLEDV